MGRSIVEEFVPEKFSGSGLNLCLGQTQMKFRLGEVKGHSRMGGGMKSRHC